MPKKKYSKKRPAAKQQSWHTLRRKKCLKRKLRLFGLSITVLIGTLLLFGFVSLWQHFSHPQAQATNIYDLPAFYSTQESFAVFITEYIEDEQNSWVLVNPKVLVVNKMINKMYLFDLPQDFIISTCEFGEVSLSGFGRLFQKEFNINPLTDLETVLGIPLEGVFIAKKGTVELNLSDKGFLNYYQVYQTKVLGKERIISNMSSLDLINLVLFRHSLMSSDLVETVWNKDLAAVNLERNSFLREVLRLEIINAEGKERLAAAESEKLATLGIKVSSAKNINDVELPESITENTIFLQSENFSGLETVKYLRYRYRAQLKIDANAKYPASLVIFNEP